MDLVYCSISRKNLLMITQKVRRDTESPCISDSVPPVANPEIPGFDTPGKSRTQHRCVSRQRSTRRRPGLYSIRYNSQLGEPSKGALRRPASGQNDEMRQFFNRGQSGLLERVESICLLNI